MIKGLFLRSIGLLATAAGTWLVLALVVYLLLPRTIETIYQGRVRDILQHSCGRFLSDPLLYTLEPGVCRFANPEFDTRVVVDADGFRNAREHRGNGPIRVAVTGDSHAMGWGVEQGEKIASLIATDPRFTVRDLAMSSYGTARELVAVLRHARDADVVVIQYCDNDRAENAAFLSDPAGFFSDAAARAAAYATNVRLEMASSEASPMVRAGLRWTIAALARTWHLLYLPPHSAGPTPSRVMDQEAALFAGVLAHFKSDLEGKTVLVFDSQPRRPRPAFAETFKKALSAKGMGQVAVLDLVGTLGPRDFFHIDEHIRPSGHTKIAARIVDELGKPGRLPNR